MDGKIMPDKKKLQLKWKFALKLEFDIRRISQRQLRQSCNVSRISIRILFTIMQFLVVICFLSGILLTLFNFSKNSPIICFFLELSTKCFAKECILHMSFAAVQVHWRKQLCYCQLGYKIVVAEVRCIMANQQKLKSGTLSGHNGLEKIMKLHGINSLYPQQELSRDFCQNFGHLAWFRF